ncbi:transposase [Candidatus Gastranaerophilus sp. (ex Termes propinquus)]|nr:transposase [Candidatus Gastranaerophilus sp. (ex Termes propinquus)]
MDLIKAFLNFRNKYPTQKQADDYFLTLYNSGEYLKHLYKKLGPVSIGTIYRWVKLWEECEHYEILIPKYKYSKIGEYNTILTPQMQQAFLRFLLHPNKFKIGKAISLTIHLLEQQGVNEIPTAITFRRFATHFKKNNFDKYILMREGEKALDEKVLPYIERYLSQINVGDIFVADGHRLNFQVINPFTGKPTRPTLVGFFDWKSGTLAGYEIMLEENAQCVASALRNAILNFDIIPKVVYQDNGKAFKAKFFQDTNFDEEGFAGVYQNLGIKSVFAKPYNAKAKVIERFFLEFQESFEKLMPSYIGTSIENKPPHLCRNEKFHVKLHQKMTGSVVPTIQQAIQFINYWLEFYNSKPCKHIPQMTIKQVLNSVERQNINEKMLNHLMMKTEVKTIYRNGIKFLGFHYFNEMLTTFRDKVLIRYSLFDLTKIQVYSVKGEFLCIAKRVTATHPMAHHLGTVRDMEDLKQKIHKQKKLKGRLIKDVQKMFPTFDTGLLEVEVEEPIELPSNVVEFEKVKKQSPRQIQMNKPMFSSDFEKCEWLKANGCTSQEDRQWLQSYISSEEYSNLYGD